MSSNDRTSAAVTQWQNARSGSALRRLVFIRIENFFSFQANRSRFPEVYRTWHAQQKDLKLQDLLTMAVTTLKLRSIRDTGQAQVTNAERFLVLTPMSPRMEAPEHYRTPPRANIPEQPPAPRTDNPSASSTQNPTEVVDITDNNGDESPYSSNDSTLSSYTKIEIDDLFLKNSYSRTEIDEFFQKKTYSKTEIDDFFKNHTYTKTEVDNMFTEKLNFYTKTEVEKMIKEKSSINAAVNKEFQETLNSQITTLIAQNTTDASQAAINKFIEDKLKEITPKFETYKTTLNNDCDKIVKNKQTEIEGLAKTEVTKTTTSLLTECDKHIKTITEHTNTKLKELDNTMEKCAEDLQDDVVKAVKLLKNMTTTTTPPSTPAKHPLFPNVNVSAIIGPGPHAPSATTNTNNTTYNPVTPRSGNNNYSNISFNLSGFHEHFMAMMEAPMHILNFYQQLHTQGRLYGIHCIPLTQINPYNDLCPAQVQSNDRTTMATTIYQKLQHPDCVAKSFQAAQNILLTYASSSDGFKVLKQLLRLVHPKLNTKDILREQPTLSRLGDVFSYADAVRHFLLVEHIQGRDYAEREQSLLFCQQLDVESYRLAKERCINEIVFQTQGNKNIQDQDLLLDSIPITIVKYQKELGGGTSAGMATGYIRQLTNDPDDVPTMRALTTNVSATPAPAKPFSQRTQAQCRACGTWGHTERQCSVTGKTSLVLSYIDKHPKEAKKLAHEYQRVNSKSLKQGVVRALLSLPALQYEDMDSFVHNLTIPMDDITSDSDN